MRLQIKWSMAILRIFAYKISFLTKRCMNTIAPMQLKDKIQNLLGSLNRSRKLVLIIILICAVILYLWPSALLNVKSTVTFTPLDLCIASKVEKFQDALKHSDAVITHEPKDEGEEEIYPFVGNGYIGAGVVGTSALYIKSNRILSVPVHFHPIVTVNIEGLRSKSANVIDIKSGLVYRIECYQLDSVCTTAASQVFAHRLRPSVLVQEFVIHNPGNSPVTLELQQIGISDWTGAKSEPLHMTGRGGKQVDYELIHGLVKSPVNDNKYYMVVIANTKLPDIFSVPGGKNWKYKMMTVIRYSEIPVVKEKAEKEFQKLQEAVKSELTAVLMIDNKFLNDEHTDVWAKLWFSGFGISLSKAKGALNGHRINTTMYYVLSNMRSLMFEKDRTDSERNEMEKLLYFPDRCYEGHQTLQNAKMWANTHTAPDVTNVVTTWMITLEKHGCASMLRAGAEGGIQAMILSFGALKFRDNHLEFGSHPSDLHRNYYFRRINYGNNTHLNISVIVGMDNKAVLYAALDRNDKPYYACDAGCLDAPMKLSRKSSQFPVKLTDPVTAILYVTADKMHMEELKHAIHVRTNDEAPAHEHHVIALHRHGTHYGGLPTMFWVSIGFLIGVFHLFLFKLILNEYCQSADRYLVRGKYNL